MKGEGVGVVPSKSELLTVLKHYYGALAGWEELQVDVYVIESTGKTTKDTSRWYIVHQLILDSEYRNTILAKFKEKYQLLLRAISSDDVEVVHLYDYNSPEAKTLKVIEPERVKTFQTIINKIKQEGDTTTKSFRKIKRLSGFAIDIVLKNGNKIIFFVKGRKKVVLKRDSFMFGLWKRELKIADDDYASIPVSIDAIYIQNGDSEWLIAKNVTNFETLFRFYEHYKQASKEIISKLKELEIIEFENEDKTLKEFFRYPTLPKRLFQLKENGVFDFFDKNGNLTDNYWRFHRRIKEARMILDDAQFEIVKEEPTIKIKILNKKGLSQLIKICQGKIIVFSEMGDDTLNVGEVRGTVKQYKTLAKEGAQALIQTVLDKWVEHPKQSD